MGGLMILAAIVVSSLIWANLSSSYVWAVLLVMLGFGAIGFYDDYLKVTKQSHKGFSGKARLGLEVVIAGIAVYFISRIGTPPFSTSLTFPFFKEWLLNLGIFFIPFGAFVIVGAGNAVNLTDGLDGLAIVPVMIAAATFGVIAYVSGNAVFSNYLQIHFTFGTGELAVVMGAVIGAGLGFLWFNAPPAAIFMGDTGSLALGGLIGTTAVATKHEIVMGIVGGLVRHGGDVRYHPGRLVQDDRQARVPHGADPSSFRKTRMDRKPGGRAVLDHFGHAGIARPCHAEAAVNA